MNGYPLPLQIATLTNSAGKGKNIDSKGKQTVASIESGEFSDVLLQLVQARNLQSTVEGLPEAAAELIPGKNGEHTAQDLPENKKTVSDELFSQNEGLVKKLDNMQELTHNKPELLAHRSPPDKAAMSLTELRNSEVKNTGLPNTTPQNNRVLELFSQLTELKPGFLQKEQQYIQQNTEFPMKNRPKEVKNGATLLATINNTQQTTGDKPGEKIINRAMPDQLSHAPDLKTERISLQTAAKLQEMPNSSHGTPKTELRSLSDTLSPKSEATVQYMPINNTADGQEKHFTKQHAQHDYDSQAPKTELPKPEALPRDQVLFPKQADFAKPEPSNVAEQMVQKMKLMVGKKQSSLEVHLKPEHLGKVKIQLHLHEGNISVRIVTENGQTANLLNSNIQQIRDNLEQQGLKLQDFGVDVSSQDHGEKTGYDGRGQARENYATATTANLEADDLPDIPVVAERNTATLRKQIDILA